MSFVRHLPLSQRELVALSLQMRPTPKVKVKR